MYQKYLSCLVPITSLKVNCMMFHRRDHDLNHIAQENVDLFRATKRDIPQGTSVSLNLSPSDRQEQEHFCRTALHFEAYICRVLKKIFVVKSSGDLCIHVQFFTKNAIWFLNIILHCTLAAKHILYYHLHWKELPNVKIKRCVTSQ